MTGDAIKAALEAATAAVDKARRSAVSRSYGAREGDALVASAAVAAFLRALPAPRTALCNGEYEIYLTEEVALALVAAIDRAAIGTRARGGAAEPEIRCGLCLGTTRLPGGLICWACKGTGEGTAANNARLRARGGAER